MLAITIPHPAQMYSPKPPLLSMTTHPSWPTTCLARNSLTWHPPRNQSYNSRSKVISKSSLCQRQRVSSAFLASNHQPRLPSKWKNPMCTTSALTRSVLNIHSRSQSKNLRLRLRSPHLKLQLSRCRRLLTTEV